MLCSFFIPLCLILFLAYNQRFVFSFVIHQTPRGHVDFSLRAPSISDASIQKLSARHIPPAISLVKNELSPNFYSTYAGISHHLLVLLTQTVLPKYSAFEMYGIFSRQILVGVMSFSLQEFHHNLPTVKYLSIGRACSSNVHLCFSDLLVARDWRNQGFGSLLLLHCEKISKSRYFGTCKLHVDLSNSAAIAFYLKHGYRPTDVLEGTPLIAMEKILQ